MKDRFRIKLLNYVATLPLTFWQKPQNAEDYFVIWQTLLREHAPVVMPKEPPLSLSLDDLRQCLGRWVMHHVKFERPGVSLNREI